MAVRANEVIRQFHHTLWAHMPIKLANRIPWLLDEDTEVGGITTEMTQTADAAMTEIMLAAMTPETKAWPTAEREQITVAHTLEMVEEIFKDNSKSRQEELRKISKQIKM